MQSEPQLITYVDRLAGDFDGLLELLEGLLAGLFGGVHLLPFYDPIDGADAGFDPVDHTAVDHRLGHLNHHHCLWQWSTVGGRMQSSYAVESALLLCRWRR